MEVFTERTLYVRTFSSMADKNISHTQRLKKLGRHSHCCTLVISYIEPLVNLNHIYVELLAK